MLFFPFLSEKRGTQAGEKSRMLLKRAVKWSSTRLLISYHYWRLAAAEKTADMILRL
jgi:hypothetical protein